MSERMARHLQRFDETLREHLLDEGKGRAEVARAGAAYATARETLARAIARLEVSASTAGAVSPILPSQNRKKRSA